MKVLDNEVRRHILKELSTKENLTFMQLFQNKFYSSSQFNYHLNWLLKNQFIKKLKLRQYTYQHLQSIEKQEKRYRQNKKQHISKLKQILNNSNYSKNLSITSIK